MRFSVAKKLALGFGSVLALMATSSIVVYSKVQAIQTVEKRITGLRNSSIFAEKDLQTSLALSQKRALDLILTRSASELRARARKQFDDVWNSVDQSTATLDTLAPQWTLPANRDRLASLKEETKAMRRAQDAAVALSRSYTAGAITNVAKLFTETATPASQKVRATLNDIIESQFVLLSNDEAELAADGLLLNRTILVTTVAAIVIGFVVALLLSRRLSAAVSTLLARAEAIARGDLTGRHIDLKSRDELADLATAINRMEQSLRTIVDSILVTTERFASASDEISASATQQSTGSDTQKDQTHQVATAMQEVSSTIAEISRSSSRAAEAASKASESARGGGRIVEDTLTKMRAIADSVGATAQRVQGLGTRSNQIGLIISVIDDIADQTNLLALNAAIEAARAGEQGRGFAVVAEEVRRLAERTSKATKEISAMIHAIQDETKSVVSAMETGTTQVQAGVETTTEAGLALNEIIQSAQQVGDMVTHIATAATQQSSATEEINVNVEQIAKITAESAAGAQQSAKACHDLSTLALDLQNIVAQFKLGANGKAPSHRSQSRVAASFDSPHMLTHQSGDHQDEEALLSHSR